MAEKRPEPTLADVVMAERSSEEIHERTQRLRANPLHREVVRSLETARDHGAGARDPPPTASARVEATWRSVQENRSTLERLGITVSGTPPNAHSLCPHLQELGKFYRAQMKSYQDHFDSRGSEIERQLDEQATLLRSPTARATCDQSSARSYTMTMQLYPIEQCIQDETLKLTQELRSRCPQCRSGIVPQHDHRKHRDQQGRRRRRDSRRSLGH